MADSQYSSRMKRDVVCNGHPSLDDLLECRRRGLGLHLLDEPPLFLDRCLDLVPVVVVVGQGRMDLGERDRRVVGDNLGGGHAHPLVPDGDVPDLDAMAEDMGLPAAVPRLDADVLRYHGESLRLGAGRWGVRGFHKSMLLPPHSLARFAARSHREFAARGSWASCSSPRAWWRWR